MSFEAFFVAIRSVELQAVARHWQGARGRKPMPAWRDIDPVLIGRYLRYVWAWKYDRAADRFTGRLAGEEIDHAFGKSLRGADMESFYPPEGAALVMPRHRRVVNQPAFMHGAGMVFGHVGRTLVGERIIMPLSEDGAAADGIFGGTVYRPAEPGAARVPGPDFAPEQVAFFALDPEGLSATSG
ncbi:MAG TPA: PAS domain-containing protein [Dongiaceae bacterium]|jgi:hypothetical protein|nr:PAS domain-containing protein [Dongiaceae bacterium]